MHIEAAGSSHVGMKRSGNEDSFLILEEESLFAVADGMGGHASGEIASKLAVAELEAFFRLTGNDRELTWPFKMDPSRDYDENRLITGILQANARIVDHAKRSPQHKGMGTTVASVYFTEGTAYLGWAGDSRIYRLREGSLALLSEDHSLLNDLLRTKRLAPEDAEDFPHKNVIVRALGIHDSLAVEVIRDTPRDGDLYLLCSDGLSGMVSDLVIERILLADGSDDEKVTKLIQTANDAGGIDNVTVVLARYRS